MYLRDIAIYADENIVDRFPSGFVAWFHRETCCITDMYVSLLNKRVLTPDTDKVNLRFTDTADSPHLRQLLSVADAIWFFDFAKYSHLDDPGKKETILVALRAALTWIAASRQWDPLGIIECYDDVVRNKLTFQGWSKKSWVSPDPRYKIRIGFTAELRMISFFVGVFDRKGNEISRRALGSTIPEMGLASLILRGAGKWTSGATFRLELTKAYLRLPKHWQVDLSDLIAIRG